METEDTQSPSENPEDQDTQEENNTAPSMANDPEVTDVDPENVTADDEDDEDPLEAYYKARREQEKAETEAELEARIAAQFEAKRLARERQQAAESEQQALRDTFTDTMRTVYSNLKNRKFYDADHREIVLSDSDIEQMVLGPFQAYNASARDTLVTGFAGRLQNAALSLVPNDVRDKFLEESSTLEIDDYLKLLAEYTAPTTKAVAKLKEQEEIIKKAEYARGYAKGSKAPPGSPPSDGERPSVTPAKKFDLNTESGRAGALAAGQITPEKYRELRRAPQPL